MKYDYRIGLDIGIDSVGWAALEHDDEENPRRIMSLGSRVFSAAEHPKDGSSLAQPRREARGARRRLRRRAHRLERVRSLVLKHLLTQESIDDLYSKESISPNDKYPNGFDVYYARYLALDEIISNEDLARVMIAIAKRRGFKSNRKADLAEDKEGTKLLIATKNNRELRLKKGYRTVGEMLYKDEAFHEQFYNSKTNSFEYRPCVRNGNGEYSKSLLLEENLEEIKIIFQRQRELGNNLSEELEKEYIDILTSRRAFDEGPGAPSQYRGTFKVGRCTFEKDELRASKGCYTFEYFRALQNLNHIKLSSNSAKKGEPLTNEQRYKLIDKIKNASKLTYAQARKHLELPEDIKFTNLYYSSYDKKKQEYKDPEKGAISNFENSSKIKKIISNASIEELDEVATILGLCKSDDRIEKGINESCLANTLSKEQIESIKNIKFEKHGNLSLKAMKKIIMHMEEQGATYDKACDLAGYDFRAHCAGNKIRLLNTQEIYEQVKDIPNPVVRRSISQTLKVLNSIIREYGSPKAIVIELAREMAKNRDERNKLLKQQEENKEANEAVKKEVSEMIQTPSPIDFLKWRLYKEQQGVCAYSLKKFDSARIFEQGYAEVDHIIPYSRSNNNSYANKVLVFKNENQAKKNMTPFEYYKAIGRDFDELQGFAEQHIRNKKKKAFLTLKDFTDKDAQEMQERTLIDTKYIARFIKNLIQDNLFFEESKRFEKRPVNTVNGNITSFLRTRWGLNKIREEGDLHHAQDAVVIACTTPSMIQRISTYYQWLENPRAKEVTNYETGEILTIDEYFDQFSEHFPKPYDNFKKELEIRLFKNPEEEMYINELIKIGYTNEELKDVKRVFVSRMPNHKHKGQIYQDTVYSGKFINDKKGFVLRTDLTKLKLKDGEIEDYFRPQDDINTYNALKKRLLEYGCNAENAFKEPIFKPKKDGKPGNQIKKVKLYYKKSLQPLKEENKSYAANASQIRVDFFTKDGRFYMVPIYISDYYANRLPNKALKANTPQENWVEMDDSFTFNFSLYSNDLIYVENEKGFNMSKVADVRVKQKDKSVNVNKINKKKSFLYFIGVNINNLTSLVINHDKSYEGAISLGSFDIIKKCEVDVLGRVKIIDKLEKRRPLR